MKPTLDSRQIHAFSALARRGSFTRAARDLFLTQSAVSHAIKALEEDVGCRLLDRVGRRVRLTQAGEEFLRHVEKILREMETARAGLEILRTGGHGRLRVGTNPIACQYILPAVLGEYRERFPQSAIRLEPGENGRLLELLRTGQIDLALGFEPAGQGRREFTFVPLFQDELRFVVAPTHPWSQLTRIPREGIQRETLVLPPRTSHTFHLVADYFRRERITLGNFIELGSMEATKEVLKLGLGVGVIAPWIARAELEDGSLVVVPLGSRRLARQWGIVFLKGRRLAPGEETFAALCQSVSATLQISQS
jgi:LysR family transcriptional regulator, low CO2-responsive transcriptional regulator